MTNPMSAQIHSLPTLIAEALPTLEAAARETVSGRWAKSVRRVVLTGCGDSHHAALVTELAFEALAGLPTEPMTAMQFSRYAGPQMDGAGVLVAGMSVSGAVARTAEALQMARHRGAETLAVTANPTSRVATSAGRVLPVGLPPFPNPPGLVVPGVRTYLGNVLALYLVAVQLGEARGALTSEAAQTCRAELRWLAQAAEDTLVACDEAARALAEEWADAGEFVFTGAGPNYGTALYAAAKLLEASGDAALGQDTEEWAHLQYFARAAATPTLIISAGGRDTTRAAEVAVAATTIGRRVAAIAPAWAKTLTEAAGRVLPVALKKWDGAGETPRGDAAAASVREAFSPVLTAIPAALFAAHRADVLGEPFFRAFEGGRHIREGGGISRIQSSEMLAGLYWNSL